MTLRDNLPDRCGSTWRRGYEPAAASSARDKDRPLSPSPSSVFWSPLLPAATGRAPLPASGRPAAPSLAVGLSCHPRPRVFTLHFSLIARFCKLVSISMLHLLPFTVFARPCGKKRGAQRKANPLTAQEGEAPGTAALKVRVSPSQWLSCSLPTEATQEARSNSQSVLLFGGTKLIIPGWLIITYIHIERPQPLEPSLSKAPRCCLLACGSWDHKIVKPIPGEMRFRSASPLTPAPLSPPTGPARHRAISRAPAFPSHLTAALMDKQTRKAVNQLQCGQ